MTVTDLTGTHEVSDLRELDAILSRRQDGKNWYWLAHGTDLYPTLTLVVKGDLAYLWFVPNHSNPGFNSIATDHGLDPNGSTTFSISEHTGDDIVVLNS